MPSGEASKNASNLELTKNTQSVPLSTIVSAGGSVTHRLAQRLQPRVHITYYKNSVNFQNKLQDIRLSANHILASFDIVPNIPAEEALQMI